ncbi:MAG: glycosyltransferase family 4 protein [Candidatus Limnocylindria bacterium]
MNILQIRPSLPVGGATEYIVRLSQGLVERGHRVMVVSGGGAWDARIHDVAEQRTDFRLSPYLGPSRSTPNVVDLVPTSIRLARLVRRERIQLINSHHRYAALIGRLVARLTGTRLVSTIHEIRNDQRRLTAAGMGERLIVLSQAVERHAIERYGVDPGRIRVIPMGMEMPVELTAVQRRALLDELGIGSETPLIGCVARLRKRKGQRYLLEALASVTSTHPDVCLLLIGDGEDRAELEERTRQLGLSGHVKFLGARNDVSDLIALCQFTVLPSLQEEFGIVLLESLVHGRPVVASSVGGIPEIVTTGEHGLLVPPADSERLADAIKHLLGQPRVTAAMGERGRRLVAERYSMAAFIEATERVYADLLASHH